MSVREGIYVVHSVSKGDEGLGIGPIPLIYPPPTTQLRVLSGFMVDKWRLIRQDGGFVITDRNPKGGYSVIRKENRAFVQWVPEGFPNAFSIEPAGSEVFTIKELSEDLVFTRVEDGGGWGAVVNLQPANGSDAQKWKFNFIGED